MDAPMDVKLTNVMEAASKHNIEIYDVKSGAGGKWFIKCRQLVNVDGCGVFASYVHTDLDEMYDILYNHFEFNEEIDLMNIFSTNLFKYLAGEMFLNKNGSPLVAKLTIKDVKVESIPNGRGGMDDKPVMSFKERDKLLVLNKTNAKAIVGLYGGETDDWKGKQIAVTAERGTWFGKSGVRVIVLDTVPANGNSKPVKKAEPPVSEDDIEFDDELPAREELEMAAMQGVLAAQQEPLFDDLTGAYHE